ncbi:MAG: DNA sulfur modification protein DndD [Candidatus Poribacteria bacterium]|nr:DNA sulfur modification protein DndD [Candidatus Poribacteria bacterium]
MIIHKLTLNNIGLFRGTQTINLTPNGKGPIILIGGMNGAGKTTLLDAIRLCLYGRRSLGNRVSHNEYYDYLSSLIHRGSDSTIPLNHAAVSLEFEYAHSGETKQYRIERTWQRSGSKHHSVSEGLTISENNWLNTEFDAEHWQDRIYEFIPIGVSQFFFFDGEDIQKLADDSKHDLYLAESTKALLGINLVERLQSDLRIYANRLVKRDSPEPVQKEIVEVEAEIATLESALRDTYVRAEALDIQSEKLENQIERQELIIAAEGGGYAAKRESLKVQQGQLLADIEALETDIRDLCGELFPFALVPDLLKKLEDRLLKEIELDEWEAKNLALESVNTEVLKTLASAAFWDSVSLPEPQIEAVRSKITPFLKTQLEKTKREQPETLRGFKKIRDRSPSEYGHLLEWIDACLNEVPQEFRELNDTLAKAQLELQKVDQDLQKVPAEEVLKPLIEKLSLSNQELGQLHKEEQEAEQSIKSLEYQLEVAERKLDKLRHTQQLGEAHVQRQQRVENVQSVLSAYTTRLTQAKIATLSEAIVQGFNQLSHKPDRIRRVEIDPLTFAVTLYDTQNRALRKEKLSAGEKQIYTTALLWALAKTSGKALPMILDTPLGRLDSSHRRLLIERYFPYASHQVVLLSTDTEVQGYLRSLLDPYISRTFHLVYQQVEGYTTIKEGYFG